MFSEPRKTIILLTCTVLAFVLGPSAALAVNSVGDLKKIEGQVQSLVDKALPCTVCVVSARGQGSGSGVTVSADGLILTAAHVTQAAGEDLVVIFPDGRKVKAKSLGANQIRDAGMVQITEPGEYPFVEVGKSKDLKINDWCVSLGHAGGYQADRTPPVRLGRILGNGRFVVTDCTIIGGDSGGPLFDLEGRVIGIHSNIGESLSQNQHVPIDVFSEDWERMKKGETWGGERLNPRQLVMGVQLNPQPNDAGVVLAGITPNSPADRAGLEAGDIIAKIDGKKMRSAADVVGVVRGKRPGDRVKLKVKRGEETKDFELRLVRAGQLQRGGPPQRRGQDGRQRRRRPPLDDESTDKESSEKDEPAEKAQPTKEKDDADANDEDSQQEASKADEDKPSDNKQVDKKSDAESSKPSAEKEKVKGRTVEELIREARRSGGRLELSQEERERLQKFMLEQFQGQGGRIGMQPTSQGPDEWFIKVMKAYEPVVAIASDSTYRILVDGKQVALGTAVSADTLLTKASEIDNLDFEVALGDDERVDGSVLKVFNRYDLALVQIAQSGLKPIELSSDEKDLPLGTFIASVDTAKEPAAIGLISVKTRKLAAPKGYLGVLLEKNDDRIMIRNVEQNSPADKAGLKDNDVIIELDEKKYEDLPNLIKAVGSHSPDDEVELLVRRGDEELEITAKLGTRTADPRSRIERMNQMGSELSDMRSGFPLALQHDCPIEPNACGGPLVNLDGEVVGINIARAGRVKSYALPAYVIGELLTKVNAEAKAAN